jgi:polysaccharide export outer membrane protein
MTTIKEGSRFLGLEGSRDKYLNMIISNSEQPNEPNNRMNRDIRSSAMRKIFSIGIILAWMVLMCFQMAYSQETKEPPVKPPSRPEWAPVSEAYVIGPEDVLYIHVWKEEALSRTVLVRMDGKISLPLVDDVQAAGLTARQLKDVLTKRLREFVDNPNVSVIVTEPNSFKVYVSGQVRSPGVVRLRSETSILQLITMVGGFTEWANQKKILIIRKEDGKEKRITVNYKKIVKGDAPESNIILKSGDQIIVP